MGDSKYVYPYSNREAHRLGPLDVQAWTVSFQTNVACKQAIETAIANKEQNLKPLIEEFGYDRINFVLAASVQSRKNDSFSAETKEWARCFWIPESKNMGIDYRAKYSVSAESTALESFIGAMRDEYNSLNLWNNTHCNSKDGLDYVGKIMVIDPTHLKDEYKSPDNQLILCQHGFGCVPEASGRKVYGVFFVDDEKCQYERSDFIGELKTEFLPDWAKEKLRQLTAPNEAQQSGMSMT